MCANVAQLARRVKMSCLWQVSSQSGEQFAIATGKSSVDAQKQYFFIKNDKNMYANVAQLVEQLIRNQQVAGSSPAISSKKKSENYSLFSFRFFLKVGFENSFPSNWCNFFIIIFINFGLFMS